MILRSAFPAPIRSSLQRSIRRVSTLQSNPHIYIHPGPSPNTHTLSLLETSPPNALLSIGTTTSIPPTPTSLTENSHFLTLLHSTLRTYAHQDPTVRGQAAAFASSSGSSLGSGASLFPQQQLKQNKKRRSVGDGAGGASAQGGAGGAGKGGWVHVSDLRQPPDFGRIAWPEDIFGSLEVDGNGEFVKGDEGKGEGVGRYVESGTYRVVTREGILGLTDFLRGKLVESLKEEEKKQASQ